MTQALGMAPGLSSLVMYIGTGGKAGQTLDDAGILNAMATAQPLNAQLSESWTWYPSDPSTDNPYFEEFAAQGQNFFQASGDHAEWTTAVLEDKELYPADDPYVTSVGGTDLTTSSAGGPWASETAWSDSGGGISPSPDDFAIPPWQTTTASGCSACSKTYRNGPDVAANANFTFYVCADQTTCTENFWGGTSFAAPMWAGYLALANQQASSQGQSSLGFINSAIYTIGLSSSYDTDFHDITSGSNGYSATVGYDLVTGWGSPNGSALINAANPFNLTLSPETATVAQGGSGKSTITTTVVSGFDSVISLTATGQPSGVTVSFSPTSITGAGSSTMTVTVASSAAAGGYTIFASGTPASTPTTKVAPLSLTVIPARLITPSSVNFNVVVPGPNCGAGCAPTGFGQYVTISNATNYAISFPSAVFSSSNGEFGITLNGSIAPLGLTGNCPVSPSTLASLSTCQAIAYTNETSTAGTYSGTVTVSGTDESSPPTNVSASLTATATVTVQ